MHVYDISGPADIRQLSIKELEALAAEIRAFLIESISRTGGHLSQQSGHRRAYACAACRL